MAVAAVVITAMIAAMFHPFIVHADENRDDSNEYEISVPEEQADYVILSEGRTDKSSEVIVSGDNETIAVSDKKAKNQGEDLIIEKNISFSASRKNKKIKPYKSDSRNKPDEHLWVSSNNADNIKKKYNADWNRKMIKVDSAKSERTTVKESDTVKIAVLDSGVDFAFTDANVTRAVNLVENEQNYENMMNDLTGHGTSVASIISEINPDAEIYSVRVLDRDNKSTLSRVVAGIYWSIDNGADIINMSFGTLSNSEILHKAVEDAENAGILMISAAGNDPDASVEYPARFNEVVAVGSVDAEGTLSDSTANGEEVELLAPGEEVFTESMLGLYTQVDGTSVAAPHAAAAASLIWQKDKEKSSAFVRGLLDESANRTISDETEAGIVDVEFADELYDEYEEDSERVMPENENEIETYSDGEKSLEADNNVSARWGSAGGGHKTLMDFGISKLKSGKFTSAEVTALKNGSVYPDAANLSHECYHGRRTTNWIASYKYLTAMAKKMRTSYTSFSQPTGQDVFGKGTFTSIVSIMKSDIKFDKVYWNSKDEPARSSSEANWKSWYSSGTYKDWGDAKILRDCNYSALKAAKNNAQIAKLKSLFIYGLALHDLTDTFAHAAYTTNKSPYVKIVHKADVQTAAQKKQQSPYVTDADNPSDYPNRWLDSKYASAELVRHAAEGKEGQIVDFEPNDYRVNGTGKARGYYLHRITEKACAIKDSNTYRKAFASIDCASFK